MNINFRYIIIALGALMGLIVSSCTDDTPDLPCGSNPSGLTLMVPDAVSFTSRAVGDNPDAELRYTSLYFFAFAQGKGTTLITPLAVGAGSPGFVSDGYRSYPLQLENGRYKFYLVANYFDAGTETSALPQSEAALKDKLMEFDGGFAFIIPDTGIPMSADHTDFVFSDTAGNRTQATDPYFEYNGESGRLIAEMTFGYAKVTVEPQDAGGNPIEISGLSVENYSRVSPVIFRGETFSFGTVAGPKAVSDPYTTKNTDDETVAYTFYVPERYISAAADATLMSLTIDGKEVAIPLGQTSTMEPADINKVPEADELPYISRGYHYIYTLTTTDKINVVVEPWTPKSLAAKLNGSVYLHIEKDEYEITAGEETAIWFDSSVGQDLTIESPTYTIGETTYKLYTYSVNATADTLRVGVNEAIPSAAYQAIKDAEPGVYDYFHIVAGNIMKRVNVSPLSLDYYLRLNPENIALDVKLRVASGEYQGNLPVTIRSNYPQVKVYLVDGWDDIPANSGDSLKVISPEDTQVTAAGVTSPMTGGRIQYFVDFKGMNSGIDIWKTARTLTFEVAGLDENGDIQESIPVTINIIPSILNYKIHFKADGWTSPHIYIYQCLEFPADYKGIASDGTPLANKPIGYQDGDNGSNNYNAALEYSFSGAISFRGWDFPVNHSLLYNADGTQILNPGVEFKQGFYTLGAKDTWDVQRSYEKAGERYNYNYDFCGPHRLEVSQGPTVTNDNCPYCAWEYNKDGFTMNRLWPGIMMKRESSNDGWYEFELTGIAEPGKTLIMFANGHKDCDKRFPGDHKVGVPLFDFPSREGWLWYNGKEDDRENNNFTPTKPEQPTTKTYRIYWPQSQANSNQVHVWVEGESGGITNYNPGDTSDGKSDGSYQGIKNGYRYFEFEASVSSRQRFGYKFHTGNAAFNNENAYVGVSKFTDVDGVYSAYFDGSSWNSGEPPVQTVTTETYRIYWPRTISGIVGESKYIYLHEGGIYPLGGWPGKEGIIWSTNTAFYYCEFTAENFSGSYNCIFNNYSGSEKSVEKFNASSFTKVNGIYSAYYDGSWHSGIPTETVPSDEFRIYWPKSFTYADTYYNNLNYIHIWEIDNSTSWPGVAGTPSGDYYYYNFKDSNPSRTFNFLFHNNSGWKTPDITDKSLGVFIPDISIKENCAYFNGSELVGGRP